MKRFDVGSRVHEATYGLGSVIAVEDAFTRIQFDDNTVRKFLTSLAKIDPSDEPAPTSRPRARKRKTATKTTTKKAAAKKTATKKAVKKVAKKTVKSD
jgi:hypothetical protein